eukprot:1159092-Pelagomonas_calceolata.AAC.5
MFGWVKGKKTSLIAFWVKSFFEQRVLAHVRDHRHLWAWSHVMLAFRSPWGREGEDAGGST